MTGAAHHNVEALLMLVRDLNDHARFFARRMRMQGDVTGADTVARADATPAEPQPYAELGLTDAEYARIRGTLGRRPTRARR